MGKKKMVLKGLALLSCLFMFTASTSLAQDTCEPSYDYNYDVYTWMMLTRMDWENNDWAQVEPSADCVTLCEGLYPGFLDFFAQLWCQFSCAQCEEMGVEPCTIPSSIPGQPPFLTCECGGECCAPDKKCCRMESGDFCCDFFDVCCEDRRCAPFLTECCGESYCPFLTECCEDLICCDFPQDTCCKGETSVVCCGLSEECCDGKCCSLLQECCEGECCELNESCCEGECCPQGRECSTEGCCAEGEVSCFDIACCPPERCSGRGICCPEGEVGVGVLCCSPGEISCGSPGGDFVCCPPDQCIDNECCPTGRSFLADDGSAICCPGGEKLCGDECCDPDKCIEWTDDLGREESRCCSSNEEPCGATCCSQDLGTYCCGQAGVSEEGVPLGQCCTEGTFCCDKLCCVPGDKCCEEGFCCPENYLCCPTGCVAADPASFKCCSSNVGDFIAPIDHTCCEDCKFSCPSGLTCCCECSPFQCI